MVYLQIKTQFQMFSFRNIVLVKMGQKEKFSFQSKLSKRKGEHFLHFCFCNFGHFFKDFLAQQLLQSLNLEFVKSKSKELEEPSSENIYYSSSLYKTFSCTSRAIMKSCITNKFCLKHILRKQVHVSKLYYLTL